VGIRWWSTAALSIAVKPVALPALALLLASPMAIIGALPVLVLLRTLTRPLWAPMPDGGILGSWWVSTAGHPPDAPMAWAFGGLQTLGAVELWTGAVLLLLCGVVGSAVTENRTLRWAAWGPLVAGWGIACLFGDRLEGRYLFPAVAISLPYCGALLKSRPNWTRLICLVLLWPTMAVLTQLAQYRADVDPMATVPPLSPLAFPVDVRPIFDACSTPDATRMRALAFQIAEVAPQGVTIITDARPDGREGELFWPLQVLRPDLKVQAR
jgi:hypothetical protein